MALKKALKSGMYQCRKVTHGESERLALEFSYAV
jgi:hypothetical protein